MKHAHKYLLLACLALLSSCLKEQEDIFDEPSSLRLQNYLEQAQRVLTDSPNGWAFEIYPDTDPAMGGYVFTCQFDSMTVAVRSELTGDQEATSYYKLTNDMGAVLSFDTNNDIMHYYSTPSPELYQAYGGDFEFILDSIGTDLIKAHAKRSGNRVWISRLTDQTPAQYLEAVRLMSNSMIVAHGEATVNGLDVTADLDLEQRQASFSYYDADSVRHDVATQYAYTPTGIRLMEPVGLAGATLFGLDYDEPAITLVSSPATPGTAVALQGILPDTWKPYDFWEGTYMLNSNGTVYRVLLEPAGDGATYRMTGLNKNLDIRMEFSKANGTLVLNTQPVASVNGNQIWLCAWSAGMGYLTWLTTAGMMLVEDPETPNVFNFVDTGKWSYEVNSFLLYVFSGTASATTLVGSAEGYKDYLLLGTTQLPYLTTFRKIK